MSEHPDEALDEVLQQMASSASAFDEESFRAFIKKVDNILETPEVWNSVRALTEAYLQDMTQATGLSVIPDEKIIEYIVSFVVGYLARKEQKAGVDTVGVSSS